MDVNNNGVYDAGLDRTVSNQLVDYYESSGGPGGQRSGVTTTSNAGLYSLAPDCPLDNSGASIPDCLYSPGGSDWTVFLTYDGTLYNETGIFPGGAEVTVDFAIPCADTDGDGVSDCLDECPDNPDKTEESDILVGFLFPDRGCK